MNAMLNTKTASEKANNENNKNINERKKTEEKEQPTTNRRHLKNANKQAIQRSEVNDFHIAPKVEWKIYDNDIRWRGGEGIHKDSDNIRRQDKAPPKEQTPNMSHEQQGEILVFFIRANFVCVELLCCWTACVCYPRAGRWVDGGSLSEWG